MARPRNEIPSRPTLQADREKAEKHSPNELADLLARRTLALNDDSSIGGASREAVTVLRALLREELAEGARGKLKPSTSRTRAAQMAAMLAKASEPEKRLEQAMGDLRELGAEVDRIRTAHAPRNLRSTPPASLPDALTVQ